MSVNPSPTWKDIVAFLDSQIEQRVFRGAVPTATNLQRINGQLVPYCVVRFSSPGRSYTGNGMGGARFDTFYGFVDIMCVAPNDDIAGDIAGLVLDKLIGYKPVNGNALVPRPAAGQFTVLDSADVPQAEVHIVSLQFNYNFSGVGN